MKTTAKNASNHQATIKRLEKKIMASLELNEGTQINNSYPSDRIVKNNILIEASHDLSIAEHRIIILCALKLRGLAENQPVKIHAKEYAEGYNLDSNSNSHYGLLKEVTDKLYNGGFEFFNDAGNLSRCRFVQQITYLEDEGSIEIYLTNLVFLMLTVFNKQNPYTKYRFNYISRIKSAYGIRLYELFIQYMKIGARTIEIEEIKRIFNLDEKYSRIDNLKKRVIDEPLQQINELTDISVHYELIKAGRKVTAFRFFFSYKKVLVDHQPEAKDNKKILKKGLTDSQIKKIKIYAKEFCEANIDKMPANFTGSFNELVDYWYAMLSHPNHVGQFKLVQELLNRS